MTERFEGELVTRLAGPEDYKAILSVSKNIYDGVDYVPVNYRIFQQNQNCYMFISELNGKPISFTMYHILNDGQTAVGAAGRIHPDYRGTGLFRQHSENARNKFFGMNLGFKEFAFTAQNLDVHQKRLKDTSMGLQLVSKQPVMYYRGKREDIQKAVTKALECYSKQHTTYSMGTQEAMDILQDPENVRRLFPESHFLATNYWLILHPTPKNLRWLAKNTNIVATKNGPGTSCKLISHSCISPCQAGARMCIYIQGPQMEENLHILLQMSRGCQVTRCDVFTLLVQLSSGTDVKKMHSRMANLGMTSFQDAEQIIVYKKLEDAKL